MNTSAEASPSSNLTLRQKIGQMIIIGFHGTKPNDKQIQVLSKKIEKGLVGGVIYFGYNIKSSEQVKILNTHFKTLSSPLPLMICVDQEGGRVARLNEENGFKNFPTAFDIARTHTPKQAQEIYGAMAKMTANAGFNCVFGPVADLNHDQTLPTKLQKQNPVIGGMKRSYSADPNIVAHYARAFINAHQDNNIITSLKHFPGHGLATSDTHIDLTDITATFQESLEMKPYEILMEEKNIDMVMTAHVILRNYDSFYPATLSPTIIKELLRKRGYNGVVITDDLFMGAIQKNYSFKESILQALKADVDILLFSINHAAKKGINAKNKKQAHGQLIERFIDIIESAIATGDITEQRIQKSYDRIVSLKKKRFSHKAL